MLAIAFVIYLAAAIISAILGLLGTIGIYLALLVSIIALFLLQATLVKAVQDVRDGRADLSISETVNQATPFIGPVLGASFLAGIAIFIGFVLIIVPGLILITIWAVIVPVIVIERSGVMASFGRSRELVKGRGWHVFGTLVLTWLILFVVQIILGLIFSFVPYAVRGGLASVISGTIVAPFIALVVTLMYYRLSSTVAPAGGGPYGGYQQPQGQGYGGYQQPQDQGYGGYQQQPAQGSAVTSSRRTRATGATRSSRLKAAVTGRSRRRTAVTGTTRPPRRATSRPRRAAAGAGISPPRLPAATRPSRRSRAGAPSSHRTRVTSSLRSRAAGATSARSRRPGKPRGTFRPRTTTIGKQQ